MSLFTSFAVMQTDEDRIVYILGDNVRRFRNESQTKYVYDQRTLCNGTSIWTVHMICNVTLLNREVAKIFVLCIRYQCSRSGMN